MSQSPFNREWLQKELAKSLNWDEVVVEGVVDAITTAKDNDEVEDIVANFMSESETARFLVSKYITAQRKSGTASNSSQTSENRQSRRLHVQNNVDIPRSQKQSVGNRDDEKLFDSRKNQRTAQSLVNRNEQGRRNENRFAEHGTNSKGKRKTGIEDLEERTYTSETIRMVSNCLGCGKIYDTRKATAAMKRFIESGGICDFCGAQVNIFNDRDFDADNRGKEPETSSAKEEGTKKAMAFKDRLIEYDRNSAQRTAVLDDQSDYFEIETNVWLEEKEKIELMKRRALEDEIERAHRKQVQYTIDLLGRRVYVSKETQPTEAARQIAEAAAAAAQSTAFEIPQGGGTAAGLASQTASRLDPENNGNYRFRVVTNPDIQIASPIFLPSPAALERSKEKKRIPKWIQGTKGRIQHEDVFADFDDDLDPVILSTDDRFLQEIFEENDDTVFDLCPENTSSFITPTFSDPKPRTALSVNARLTAQLIPGEGESSRTMEELELPRLTKKDDFPDGMVLLKSWLSFEEQMRIVEEIRNLGIGPGGFYTPTCKQKAQMKIKLMCLGMNWNPVNRTYENTRSNYDGAKAPPVPNFLKELARRCLEVANRMRGRPFEPIEPNICLCNFYSQTGSIGLHQDREEGEESLKRQIPVISFSIGAAGEFIFSRTKSFDSAQSILLESGDVLIFGGPSRMIYHGIRKIFPQSMPPELSDTTGMRHGRLNLTLRQFIPS